MAFDIKTAKPVTETIEKDTSVSVSASPEMGEPIQPKEPKLKEGGFDVGSAAVFFPSMPREPKAFKEKPEFVKPPPKEFSAAEAAGAGTTGALVGFGAPKAIEMAGKGISKLPSPQAKAIGTGMELSGRVLGNVPAPSRVVGGAAMGASSDIAGQLAEQYLFASGPVRMMVEMGVGTIPTIKRSLERYIVSAFARKGGGIDLVNAAQNAGKEIATLSDTDRQTLDRMAKAIGGEKYEQGSMEYIYMLIGKEGLKDVATAQNQAKSILEKAQREADAIINQNPDAAQRIRAQANRQAMDINNQANARVNKIIEKKQQVGEAGSTALDKARSQITSIGNPKELTPISTDLRTAIEARQSKLIEAKKAQTATDLENRDKEITSLVNQGKLISNNKEYQKITQELKDKLLIDIERIPKQAPVTDKLQLQQLNDIYDSLNGRRLLVGGREQFIPPTFGAVDDIRRKLGRVFEGQPPQGYEAISAETAKDIYFKLSKAMGNYSNSHAKFISNYEKAAKDLDIFGTKVAKKATALDDYIAGHYANDPQGLVGYYFKTPTRVKDLVEITGDAAAVERAASEYVARTLRDENSKGVAAWLAKKDNSDWLTALPNLRKRVEAYQGQLAQAEEYGKKATGIVERLTSLQPFKKAEQRIKEVDRLAETEIKGLPGEREATKVLKEAEKRAAPLESEAAKIEKLTATKKSPVDYMEDILINENAPGNLRQVAQFIVRDPNGKEVFQKAVANTIARVDKNRLQDLYNKRIRYALEGSGLYSPSQLQELSMRVAAARDPNVVEKLILGVVTSTAAPEVAKTTRNIFSLSPF